MKEVLGLLGEEEKLIAEVEAAWERATNSTERWNQLVAIHGALLAKVIIRSHFTQPFKNKPNYIFSYYTFTFFDVISSTFNIFF
jgi:hypothetical protein